MKSLQQFDAEALYLELVRQIKAAQASIEAISIVGIYSGGAWLADRLVRDLECAAEVGYIDVSFYRDDYAQKGLPAEVRPTHIPFPVEGATIILVDDVLYTGRTTRAAINELFDYGRPAKILLACLVDRGGRELPYSADFVAQSVNLPTHLNLQLTLAEPETKDKTSGSAQPGRLVLTLIDKNDS